MANSYFNSQRKVDIIKEVSSQLLTVELQVDLPFSHHSNTTSDSFMEDTVAF